MKRKRILRYNRSRAPRIPISLAMSYQAFLRSFLREGQAKILAWVERHYDGARDDARRRIPIKLEEPSAIGSRIEEFARKTERFATGEVKRVVGVSLAKSDPKVAKAIPTFRKENVDLITSLQGNQLYEIEELLGEAYETGIHAKGLRKQIQERFAVSKNKADLLARDQILKLNAKIVQTRQRGAGITRYIWSTSKDERVRGTPGGKWPNGMHYELEGTIQSWDDPPITNENGDTNHPGEDYQCRCVALPILDELEETEEEENVE